MSRKSGYRFPEKDMRQRSNRWPEPQSRRRQASGNHMGESAPQQSTGRLASGPLAGAWRARGDRIAVLIVLIAGWQVLSSVFGTYWIGSPLGVTTRLVAGIASGDLLRHAAITMSEAIAGFLIGAVPAAALPFALRRY